MSTGISLRMAWIVPNVLLYLSAIGFSVFVFSVADSLDAFTLGIYSILILFILCVAAIGTMKIVAWIKADKL